MMNTHERDIEHDPARRLLLSAIAMSALAAGCAPSQQHNALSPNRVKGPRVFLDYDQVELDAAYDQSVYTPNLQQIVGRDATNSDITR
jgi:arylformamidase